MSTRPAPIERRMRQRSRRSTSGVSQNVMKAPRTSGTNSGFAHCNAQAAAMTARTTIALRVSRADPETGAAGGCSPAAGRIDTALVGDMGSLAPCFDDVPAIIVEQHLQVLLALARLEIEQIGVLPEIEGRDRLHPGEQPPPVIVDPHVGHAITARGAKGEDPADTARAREPQHVALPGVKTAVARIQ